MRPSRRRSSMGSLVLQLPTEWKAALISPASCVGRPVMRSSTTFGIRSARMCSTSSVPAPFWAAATARSRLRKPK